MATWVSLLRAVNLGAHNKVPMPALREALAAAGFSNVRTYVASGNIVTTSRHRSPDRVAAALHQVVAELTGLDVPVLVRSPAEIEAVLAANPWPRASGERPTLVQVTFLEAAPAADRAAALRTDPQTRDTCRLVGRELYVDYGDSVHASKLTPALFERRLGVSGTARNWRTVEALARLCAT